MLGQIETLLAFTAVMAAISLIITVLNQLMSALANLRGVSLRSGLSTALKSLFPELGNKPATGQNANVTFADNIAHSVLNHPLISDSVLPHFPLAARWRLATAVRFDELSRILGVLAKPEKGHNPDESTWSHEDAIAWLSRRTEVLKDWFEVTMDRVSQHFAFYMRILTLVFAILLVSVLRIDAVSLYRGLSTDVKLRNGVLASIETLQKAKDKLDEEAAKNTANAGAKKAADDAGKQLAEITTEAFNLSDSLKDPLAVASKNRSIGGMLAAIALLSLGAPFWFNMLRSLSNLRSSVAEKEEKERIAAQQAPATPKGPARTALGVTGTRNEGEVV